ncbi:hypothetical protein NAC44_14330 [Allorhizobium sp. BGMRC 0089]|nr:L,D-transpeptidase family protein [Allorhizobium sonneratiae]MCM2293503.1 hypothetical protein [Allorhizobium sonneratiae]
MLIARKSVLSVLPVFVAALMLWGCNDTLDSVVDKKLPDNVKNKVEQPLPDSILTQMAALNMDRNSPIAIRIFKEEGVLEIWKEKRDGKFAKIADYQICAWSGRLGPKEKEGDRQAPEGFYELTPANLNPYSKYYLAINTGFPNRYDSVNGFTGTNLMIHGACSSSGCYSMTDAQILEIYAFARDAFRGGQQTVQLEAFPFRMTAENMARHHFSPHYPFWQMLKAGYDQFEITQRPPEVAVCSRRYVFNEKAAPGHGFNPNAACPPMSMSPQLTAAVAAYNSAYERDYAKAMKTYAKKVWYDPTEAERKALVADLRKGHDPAFAPTGSALKAGKLLDLADVADPAHPTLHGGAGHGGADGGAAAPQTMIASVATGGKTSRIGPTNPGVDPSNPASPAGVDPSETAMMSLPATGPVPPANPNSIGAPSTMTAFDAPPQQVAAKPFWKFWSR